MQDIVTELLAAYPQLRFDFDVTQEQLPRAICTQYRESGLKFFTRLPASEGLNWHFEHDQPDDESQDGQARRKQWRELINVLGRNAELRGDKVLSRWFQALDWLGTVGADAGYRLLQS